ncbi:hypothetical protein C2857_000421 [Epichloe festucae Fl1]|uniref:Transglutaminase-like domain-containing protein n=1 Tax=Epichloe festucae (strain Fl1) TaxID=877507 RepID=A0A7U3Q134_EPIFF|nr:hypothetical protein C2857_000421 [Epichloe festucae Fl1]
MADTQEPQFNTLAERIAALNNQKNFNPLSNGVPSASEPPRRRPPPPAPPVRPANPKRSETVPAAINGSSNPTITATPATPATPARANAPPPLPRRETSKNGTSSTVVQTAPPPLPGRTPSLPAQTPPAVPRRTSTQSATHLSARRGSASSEISQLSTVSTSSIGRTTSSSYTSIGGATRNMAPATYDAASLPALPPSKRELEARSKEAAAQEAVVREARGNEIRARQAAKLQEPGTATNASSSPVPASRPNLPPRLPSRPAKSPNTTPSPAPPHTSQADEAKLSPRKFPFSAIRGFGSGQAVTAATALPTQRTPSSSRPASGAPGDTPPPVPLTSRPSVAQIEAASTRSAAQQSDGVSGGGEQSSNCWVCRDWSGPDAVAAQFPRHSLPRTDPVGHLARGLCDAFPSYDDKARAIFTWCHHNIFYDTVSFFNNDVRHHSVQDTIFSGKAVCQGYAEVYMAVAKRAGLECIVVGGHGKGFGHTALKKGERPPPAKPDGHAWNAVRVDGGAWKLVDACWGAGHICSAANLYKQEFSPRHFTLSNEQFGRRHFPKDPSHQFRADGRPISWEDYYTGGVDGEGFQWFGTGDQEGLSEDSVEPKNKDISVSSGQTVRFQFSKVCEHWTSEKAGLGKPALFLLSIHGLGGRKDEQVPVETNGYWHWVDVNARDLGAPGQSVEILKLETMGDDDGRGVTGKEFLSKRGRVGMSWSYIAKWNLVS